jgi:drug/metabolite transporter (DMT)-like permease
MSDKNHLRAIGIAITGYTLWVLSDTGIKLAGEAALPPYEIIGMFGFFGGLVMLLKVWPRHGIKGGIKTLWPKQPRPQFVRAILALTTILLNVVALKHLPLTLFYVTVFAAPMMIAVAASVLLREKLGLPKILAILAGFVGVVIAIDPLRDFAKGDIIGYAAAFAGTVCFAASSVWLRRMTQSETVDSVSFITVLVEMVAGFSLMLWHAEPLTARLIVILLIAGVISTIGNIAVYTALKHAPAATVSQFHYTQIIAGAILGYAIWSDVPGIYTIVGAAIIIASGLYIAARARKAENLAASGQL